MLTLGAWTRWERRDTANRSWLGGLPGLKEDYDFAKSWVSNATLVTGAFAGVFGATEVIEAILGKEEKNLGAVVVVAAAVASAMVLAAPLLLKASHRTRTPDGADAGSAPVVEVTSAGLTAAAFLTTAGTLGQLGVLLRVAAELDIGWFRWVAVAAGALGFVLVAVYVFRTLQTSLETGVHDPPPSSRSIAHSAQVKELQAEEDVPSSVILLIGPGDGRRTAIL